MEEQELTFKLLTPGVGLDTRYEDGAAVQIYSNGELMFEFPPVWDGTNVQFIDQGVAPVPGDARARVTPVPGEKNKEN